MKLIRHVLSATDLSPPSLHAVDRGFELAHAASARCTVMSALGLDALGPLRNLLGSQAESVTATLLEKQRSELASIVANASRNRGIVARIVVEEGLASTVVPAHAATVDADVIVVGSRGRNSVRRFLIGSTASHLLRKSRCPVLVAKTACHGPYRRALIPVDFSHASELAIRMTLEAAPDADIVLINVFDVPFESMLHYAGVTKDVIHHYRIEARQRSTQQLHELAAQAGLNRERYSAVVVHGDAAREILAHEAQHRCDLVVMGKHGTHVTEELLLGSVTRRVLGESNADVFVVVDKRAPSPWSP